MKIVIFVSGLVFFFGLFHYLKLVLRYISSNCISVVTNHVISLRVVSAVQAVMACTAGVIVMSNCTQDVLNDRHWLATGYALFATPYFIYDFWAMQKLYCLQRPELAKCGYFHTVIEYVKHNIAMSLHHLVLPIVYFPLVVWFRGDRGDFFVGCLFLFELAIPFMSTRAILLQVGWNNTVFGSINGFLFVATFFVCRILIFPFLYYAYGRQYGYPWYQVPWYIPLKCSIGCLGLLSLQVYWQIHIFIAFSKGLRKLCGKTKGTEVVNGIRDEYNICKHQNNKEC